MSQKRIDAIKELLLDNIGTPDDLFKIDIKILWNENRFRANVYRTIRNQIRLTDSYFVQVLEDATYFSPPAIMKYYDLELSRVSRGLPNVLVDFDIKVDECVGCG